MKHLIVLIVFIHLVLSKPGGRIVDGQSAEEDQFPFAVAIEVTKPYGIYFHGGALISNQWVLTSGSCVFNASYFIINLGSNVLTQNDSNEMCLRTAIYILHPDYDDEPLKNDIALIEFRRRIDFNDHIQPVSLPTSSLPDKTSVIAIGWDDQNYNDTETAKNLRWVTLSTISFDECQESYSALASDAVCAAGASNEGICSLDRGGPLILSADGEVTLVGIASFYSSGGCDNADPSGFTQVYPYLEFIQFYTGI